MDRLPPPALPDGLTARPLEVGDAPAVFALMAAQEQHDLGDVEIELGDIIGDWQRPSFDIGASTLGVLDGDRLVAYTELTDLQRCDGAVHPGHRGRGIGTALSGWVRELATSRGSDVVGCPVPQGSPGDRLLAELGYFVRWESWILALPEGREIVAQPLPPGFTIRTAQGEADHRSAWTVVEDAFLEWSVRERQSFEDFEATHRLRPGFEPWNLRLLRDGAGDGTGDGTGDGDGEVVGACYVLVAGEISYVDQLAVRRDHRHRGLARALLVDAFANGRAHGATRSELATDSRTGALGLYEKVGMTVTSTWVHRATGLTAAG